MAGTSFDRDVIRRLPDKPAIDEANYGWTGRLGDYPCLLVGDRELDFDRSKKATVLDTRKWLDRDYSPKQIGRHRRFHDLAQENTPGMLIYVFKDVGTGTTSRDEHQTQRGSRKFVGWFEILEQGRVGDRGWLRAILRVRD